MIELVYGDTPPSLNTIGTRGSHWKVRDAKERWQGIFEGLLMASQLPRACERIHATGSVRLPTRRVRDEGNYRWILEKALGDALHNGFWLPDDNANRFRFGELEFEDPGRPRTTIRLEVHRFD